MVIKISVWNNHLDFEGNKIEYNALEGKTLLFLPDIMKILFGKYPSHESFACKEDVIKFLNGELVFLSGYLAPSLREGVVPTSEVFYVTDSSDRSVASRMKKWLKQLS